MENGSDHTPTLTPTPHVCAWIHLGHRGASEAGADNPIYTGWGKKKNHAESERSFSKEQDLLPTNLRLVLIFLLIIATVRPLCACKTHPECVDINRSGVDQYS